MILSDPRLQSGVLGSYGLDFICFWIEMLEIFWETLAVVPFGHFVTR